MNILVTDGETRSALAVTRSLGRRGCNVFVTGNGHVNISASSKYCRKAFEAPNPLSDARYYSQAIEEIVIRENINMIVPVTEQSIYCLNKIREHLGKSVILACAPSDEVEAISNKYKLFKLAEQLGVGIPETIYVTGVDDFLVMKDSILNFPVVVKPAFSKIDAGERIISTKVMYASNPGELTRLYTSNPVLQYPSLIQKLIVGEGTGLFTLFGCNRHLALFSHRRLREKPPSGGVSVVSESVTLDEEMVEAARRLLSAVGWNGVAMVEFKRDKRDGKVKLMEINGRFWGSLQLAINCGMDFPALLLDCILGNNFQTLLMDYRVGYKLKWFFGTLDHLLIRLRYSNEELNLPPESPSKAKAVMDFLRIWEKNTSFDVFDVDDPAPFWFEARSFVSQALRGE